MKGQVLNAGDACGPVLVLDDPLSFWGAFDPRTGKVIDQNHPQAGFCLSGCIVLLSETRGSGGTPGGIAEAIRLGTGPAGVILQTSDVNLAVGAMVAGRLYGLHCPVLCVSATHWRDLAGAKIITIMRDGSIAADCAA